MTRGRLLVLCLLFGSCASAPGRPSYIPPDSRVMVWQSCWCGITTQQANALCFCPATASKSLGLLCKPIPAERP